jgi:hypothetical protein
MDNLDRAVHQIAKGCLVYVVDAQTGDLLPMTQDEYWLAQRRKSAVLIPHIDPNVACTCSTIIKAALRRWELSS